MKKTMKITPPKPGEVTMIANVDGDIFTKNISIEAMTDDVKPCSGCEENCTCVAEPMDVAPKSAYAPVVVEGHKPLVKPAMTIDDMHKIRDNDNLIDEMQELGIYNNALTGGVFEASPEDVKPKELIYPYARAFVPPYSGPDPKGRTSIYPVQIYEGNGGMCVAKDYDGNQEVLTSMAIIGSQNRPLGFFVPFTASPVSLMVASNILGGMAISSYDAYMRYLNDYYSENYLPF